MRRLALLLAPPLLIAVAACGADPGRDVAGPSAGGATSASPTSPATPSPTSSSSATGASPTGSGASSPSGSPTSSAGGGASATTAPDAAQRLLARMSLAQRVGQLVMVGTPATSPSRTARSAITSAHVGNLMLTGRSSKGVTATAATVRAWQRLATTSATRGAGLFVSTDQEGGKVQVLSGPGFSTIPAGTTQGGWSSAHLQAQAEKWGGQLRRAGVNLTLSPVADTVPSSLGTANPPIGHFHRELGHDSTTVRRAVLAYDAGMRAARVAVAPKHFPGLGRVRANTDTTAHVVDRVTGTTSAYLRPFAAAVDAGTPFVMVSSAIYTRIDGAHPACFSRAVITDLLRGRLGFGGVVISDDLGAAKAVAAWSPGSRAVQFVGAGGDVVLTVDPAQAAPMARALVARAQASSTFRKQVDAAALRVLRAKDAQGLLP